MAIPKITQAQTDNIIIVQGADYVQDYQVTNDAGTPIDLTGVTFESKIRSDFGTSATVLETFTVTMVDAATGTFQASLTDTQTEALGVSAQAVDSTRNVPIGFWDLYLIFSGEKFRYVQGTISVSREATV